MGQTISRIEVGKHIGRLFPGLLQVGSALVVSGEKSRVGKCMRGFTGVFASHSHMEAPARLGCAGEEHNDLRIGASGHFHGAIKTTACRR